MTYTSMLSNLFRRASCLTIRSFWYDQTTAYNLGLLSSRCLRTGSRNLLFQENRLKLIEPTLVPYCRGCISIKTLNFSSESPRPSSRVSRLSVRDRTLSKNSDKTAAKETKDAQKGDTDKKVNGAVVDESKLSVFQRFKKAYKEHAKILVIVHLVTSSVWFGSFFYAAHIGIDIIPLLEKMGFSDKIISPFRNSSLGDVALAYLMYKLATPARYTVTLAGTNFAIKYLRKAGKVPAKEKGLMVEAMKYGSTQTRTHVTNRFNHVKKHLEVRRVKMRRDARQISTKLRSGLQNVSRHRTINSHHREKLNGRKSAGPKN